MERQRAHRDVRDAADSFSSRCDAEVHSARLVAELLMPLRSLRVVAEFSLDGEFAGEADGSVRVGGGGGTFRRIGGGVVEVSFGTGLAGMRDAFSIAVGGREGDGVSGVTGFFVTGGGVGLLCTLRASSGIGGGFVVGGELAVDATAGFTNFFCGAFGGGVASDFIFARACSASR